MIKKRQEMKHQTEWCAQANKYQCMRCGKSSKYMKIPGKCTGPKCLSKCMVKWGEIFGGDFDLVRRVDR